MLILKEYQQRTLDALTSYFRACLQFNSASQAFYAMTEAKYGQGIPYIPVKELSGLPYICLRLPTGGGKTLVATYSVSIAANELLHIEYPLVLWLTPSNVIREQTLQAIKDVHHPYRQALEANIGPITILDIAEALHIQPATLNTSTTIIISTMQAFRVEDIEGRKVYEPSGALMSHFANLASDKLVGIDLFDNGQPITSLANVLRLHRPIVIVDEAHNARTGLSFETLARFRPSCILEFTATPDTEINPSNILHTVSAAELKAEGMIKLPICLDTHQDWRSVISSAVSTRNQLEEISLQERATTGEYLRPIVLLQAQPHFQNKSSLTVDVVEDYLLKEQRIPNNQISRATGTERGLEGIDLFDPTCPIRYIITVQALREGWDCSFAYVLCTVAELHGQTAVEQILGRILRMPHAYLKTSPELNKAYAFATSTHFAETANALADALVQNGFEHQEVKDLIVSPPSRQENLPLFSYFPEALSSHIAPIPVLVNQAPNLQNLKEETVVKLNYDSQDNVLIIREKLTPDEIYSVKQCFSDAQTQKAIENACLIFTQPEGRTILSIPVLAIQQGDFFVQFEESHFLDRLWSLATKNPYLSEAEYSLQTPEGGQGEIDIDGTGHVRTSFIRQLHDQMASLAIDQGWTDTDLAVWLDRNISHIDIPQNQSIVFFTALVERLMADRGCSLAQLVKDRYRLKIATANKIQSYRLEIRQEAYQQYLLPNCSTPLVVKTDICFSYDTDPMNYPYPPNSLHPGHHAFQKHYYPVVGDFKPSGEEYECAQFLDSRLEVDTWVRNLERRPLHSFWLQTSTDKFYPDFVCRLNDGRYLVVEYKGEDRWSNDDSKEKRAIGQVWEERSEGNCLFIMPRGPDFGAIQAKCR